MKMTISHRTQTPIDRLPPSHRRPLGALDHMCAFAAGEQHFQTFHNAPNPWGFVHPIFLPYDDNVRALTNWFDEIAARRNAYIKENQQ
jgi:hypothetical protein